MSVSRHGPHYRCRWRDGNTHRSRTFQTRDAAERFDRKVKDLLAAGELHTLDAQPPGIQTLETYTREAWWPDHALVRLGQDTLKRYGLLLDNRIIPQWGHVRLRDLKPGPIEAWAAKLHSEGVGDPTIVKTLTVMQSILSKAVRDEELERNPLENVRKPRRVRKRKPVAVTPLMVEKIRWHLLDPTKRVDVHGQSHPRRPELARHRDATLVSVLAYSGPRPTSECLPLRWEQIGERTITFYPGGKKGARERQTRLLKPLARDLKEWRLRSPESKDDDLVFGVWEPWAWGHWREDVFLPAAVSAGLPRDMPPRDLRGSFASLLIWEGNDVLRVARELGHSPMECLNTYGRVFEEFSDTERKPAERVIGEARAAVFGGGLRDVG